MLGRILVLFFCIGIALVGGCGPESVVQMPVVNDRGFDTPAGFQVGSVHIVGLTRIISQTEVAPQKQINVFVDVLDIFDSRIKAPCRFRFELYEFLPRSGQNLGRRIFMWEQFDLTGVKANNAAWKDHLRAYQFDLPLELERAVSGPYMLQVTCMTAGGKRLTDTFKLQ